MPFTIYETLTGKFRTILPNADSPFKLATETAKETPDGQGPDTHDWSPSTLAWTPKIYSEDVLLARVDAYAAKLRQALLTTVPGQADIYRRKQAEVDKMAALAGQIGGILGALGAMSNAAQQAAYPLLWVEKEAMGGTLILAYQNVADRIAASNAQLNAIERSRRMAKAAIRLASTMAAKNTIASSVNWPA